MSQSVAPSIVVVARSVPLGTERGRDDGRVEPLEPRADPRAVLERPEQRAARVDRVVEAARLQREEEPQVGVLRRDLPRLGGEASGLRDGRRVPGASALDEREGSRDHRHHERRRDDREQSPQATSPALRARQLALLGVPARLQELALDRGELPLVADALDRRRQARPPVEVGVVASVLLPRARRGRQLPEGAELVPILREPSAQPRPLTDQRLVGDLGRVVVDDQEPGGRELLENRGRLARLASGSAPPAGLAFGCPPSSRPAR